MTAVFGKRLSFFIIMAFCTCIGRLQAQEKIKGITMELVSSEAIGGVTVKNIRTQQVAETDNQGRFAVDGRINDYLEIIATGYQVDTVFIYDMGVKRVYLNRLQSTIELNEVVIERMTDSRLHAEIQNAKISGQYSDISQERGGLRLSPSRIFGKKAKRARKNYNLLVQEQQKRVVDRKFSVELIQSLTPLVNPQLALFREQYRPSFKFITEASSEDIQLYIMDSYKKYEESRKK